MAWPAPGKRAVAPSPARHGQGLVEQTHDTGMVVAVGLPDGKELAQVHVRRIRLEGRARSIVALPSRLACTSTLPGRAGSPSAGLLPKTSAVNRCVTINLLSVKHIAPYKQGNYLPFGSNLRSRGGSCPLCAGNQTPKIPFQ
jgi:hypothetical protein